MREYIRLREDFKQAEKIMSKDLLIDSKYLAIGLLKKATSHSEKSGIEDLLLDIEVALSTIQFEKKKEKYPTNKEKFEAQRKYKTEDVEKMISSPFFSIEIKDYSVSDLLYKVTKVVTLDVLAKYGGSRVNAAKCLGVSTRTLRTRLEIYFKESMQ